MTAGCFNAVRAVQFAADAFKQDTEVVLAAVSNNGRKPLQQAREDAWLEGST